LLLLSLLLALAFARSRTIANFAALAQYNFENKKDAYRTSFLFQEYHSTINRQIFHFYSRKATLNRCQFFFI
jgi:hypothetical protein